MHHSSFSQSEAFPPRGAQRNQEEGAGDGVTHGEGFIRPEGIKRGIIRGLGIELVCLVIVSRYSSAAMLASRYIIALTRLHRIGFARGVS